MTRRLTTRPLRAVLAALVLALALLGLSTSPSAAIDPPIVDEVSITPSSLPGPGGQVSVRARIYSEGDILEASVNVVLANGNGLGAVMQRESLFSEYWTGSITIPVNYAESFVTHQVDIFARGIDGQTANPLVGTIEQGPFEDQPPVISDTSITPTRLPSGGGPVTITATVTDDLSVAEVYADVRRSGGGKAVLARVPMAPVGGDVYQATWLAPANTTLSVRMHDLNVRATDSAGLSTRTRARTVTTAGRAVTMSPTSLSFGSVPVGTVKTLATVLTNNSTQPLSVALSIPNGTSYVFAATQTRATTLTIPAGSPASVLVTFVPKATGVRSTQVTMQLALSGQLPLSLAVTGTGV